MFLLISSSPPLQIPHLTTRTRLTTNKLQQKTPAVSTTSPCQQMQLLSYKHVVSPNYSLYRYMCSVFHIIGVIQHSHVTRHCEFLSCSARSFLNASMVFVCIFEFFQHSSISLNSMLLFYGAFSFLNFFNFNIIQNKCISNM